MLYLNIWYQLIYLTFFLGPPSSVFCQRTVSGGLIRIEYGREIRKL